MDNERRRFRVVERVMEEALLETRLGSSLDVVDALLQAALSMVRDGTISDAEFGRLPGPTRRAIQLELTRD
jgi:hypothetical protein